MRKLTTTCLAAVFLTVLPLAGTASAHTGGGVTTMGNRLEGENYSTPDSACDPDGDNEHTSNTNPSGTLYMPHSGCGVNFGTVNFQYNGSFGSFRADTWSGTGETVTSRVEIVVDGSVQASGSVTRAPGAGFATVNFSTANAIAAGNHTVRIQYVVTSGPSWSNLRLDFADFDTVMTQVGSKSTGTGCTQPPSSTHYDIRDSGITHWIYFHVAHTPLEIKRTWVNDDTGVAWADDFQTHTGATGDWCWELVKPINGTFFQPRPGNWHVETYFKTVNGTWARSAPNLYFQVWPKRTGGGVYKNTIGDGITTFGANDTARVYTNWSTTNAQSHTVRYKWYRPDGTEHTPGDSGSISLPAGQSSYQTWGYMDIAAAGASSYPGTWTVRTWIDDTNYMEQIHSLTISSTPSGPGNNNFASGTTVTASFNQSVSNSGATLESGEPQPCGGIGTTVWYRYMPSSSGTLTVDTTQGGTYDTVLSAYTGSSLGSLSNVACNDDFSGTLSQIQFAVTANTTYHIQLGTYQGGTGGSATLRLQFTAAPSTPANDNFLSATTVSAPYSASVSTTGATLEVGEPRPCGSTGSTVWYKYTPGSSGVATVDTNQAAGFNTVVAAYTGSSLLTLTNVACNDNTSSNTAQITFNVTAGTTYYLQLGGNNSASGTATFRVTYTAPPVNNNFAGATTITAPYSASVTTTAATLETNEPRPCGSTGATVWYRYTPTSTGTATVDTNQSAGFNTVLAAYMGPSLGSLINLACNDNTSANTAQISFDVTAGTTYYIQLGGNNSASGTATLRLAFSVAPTGPPNDNFSSATVIGSTPYTTTQSTQDATMESGEFAPCVSAGRSVWFRYTHPSGSPTRRMFVDTFSSNYNTTMGVWTGSAMGSLTLVACNDNARSTLQSENSWTASPGVTYSIQVAGISSATGTLALRLAEGTLLALGDSVVAGHGVGATDGGYPNNPSAAYAGKAAADLNLRIFNRARTGACAWNRFSGHASTASYCDGSSTRSILANQLPSPYPASEAPTHVVIGVGANDIVFADCLDGFMKNQSHMNNCKDPVIGPRLTALQSNLEEVIRRAKALRSPSPSVTVMGYYNPFSAAPSDNTKTCDMWFPATIARNQWLAATNKGSIGFLSYANGVQSEGYNYAVEVLGRLNSSIQAAANSQGVTFVNPTTTFAGHDMCTYIRDGSTSNTWVFGPDWNDAFVSFWSPNVYYQSRWMGDCLPANEISPYDDEQHTSVHNTTGPNYDYDLWFRPNCMVHPTPNGHTALSNLLKPTLPIPV